MHTIVKHDKSHIPWPKVPNYLISNLNWDMTWPSTTFYDFDSKAFQNYYFSLTTKTWPYRPSVQFIDNITCRDEVIATRKWFWLILRWKELRCILQFYVLNAQRGLLILNCRQNMAHLARSVFPLVWDTPFGEFYRSIHLATRNQIKNNSTLLVVDYFWRKGERFRWELFIEFAKGDDKSF